MGAAAMRRDPRGNPVSTASAEALDASERALWRLMSFYGAPFDDLDTAARADPAWPLPRLMKAGFLLSLTEPSLVAEARLDRCGADLRRRCGNARERSTGRARRLADGDWAAPARRGEILRAHRRDALACSGRTCSTSSRRHRALGAVSRHCRNLAEDDRPSLRARAARVRPRGVGALCRAEASGRQALALDARVPWAIPPSPT
jgi:hypothetical protein